MKMSRCTSLAAATLVLVPSLLAAQAAPPTALPTAQALVARYVTAIGGRAALERMPGRRERSRVEVPAQGFFISTELWTAGGRVVTRSEMPGAGVLLNGFDGEVAWGSSPATGPTLLEGTMLWQMRQGADPLAALHPDRYVQSMQTVEETDFGGARCYRLRVTTPWGETYDEFFDATTGLLAGSVRQQATPTGSIEVTSRVMEYRTVAGVRLPRVTRASMMGMEMITTVDTTEVLAVPDSVFALPPEIRALRAPRRAPERG